MINLDCRLLPCPQPVVACKESLEKYSPEEIQILVDNKPAVENITLFLKKNDYHVTVCDKGDTLWSITGLASQSKNEYSGASLVTREESPSMHTPLSQKNNEVLENLLQAGHGNSEDYAAALAHVESDKKTLVFITSNCVGNGDDALGEKLMESFLSCLKEMHLWQIILLNGGVRLTAKVGKALESLKELEANGVRILVCGACLSHYGIYEEKRVGETTNMLDIVTALDLADKVIRP